MGIEAIIGIALAAASAVTGFAGAGAQAKAAKAQAAASSRAADAQKESSAIETASQRLINIENRRQAIREERVKRAQILQSAEGTGAGRSSGEGGAVSSLSTSLGSAFGSQRSQERAAIGIGAANQRVVDARLEGNLAAARGQIAAARFGAIQSAIGGFASIFE